MPAVYLNHAGTSWPKPAAVTAAAQEAAQAEPEDWAELFDRSTQAVARFFHVDPQRLLLTPGCTAALHVAVFDLPWQPGDRVITSRFEHHALHRNLTRLQSQGVDVVTIPPAKTELLDLNVLEAELAKAPTRLVAITAACNVTGRLLPVEAAIQIAHEFDALVLIDGAQIAGWWDLDVGKWGADFFTFAGHKGPQALHGIGGLYVAPDTPMQCSAAVCEIGATADQAYRMPGYCDVGSVNLPALASLAAGCRWLSQPAQKDRLHRARKLAARFTEAVGRLPNSILYHDTDFDGRMPTVAFRIADRSAAEVQSQLAERGVIAAAGLQCAPQAHQTLGTERSGVVRCSFGLTNDAKQVEAAVVALQHV